LEGIEVIFACRATMRSHYMPAISILDKQIEKYAKQHQFQAQKRNSPV
jgi:hypothetical protein